MSSHASGYFVTFTLCPNSTMLLIQTVIAENDNIQFLIVQNKKNNIVDEL